MGCTTRKPNRPRRASTGTSGTTAAVKRPPRPRFAARSGRAVKALAARLGSALPALALPLLAAALFIALPAGRAALGALSDYEPDIDVSAGTFNYFFNEGDGAPDIGTGVFFSGYLSMKSPFFTFFFNTKNFYSTYEAGIAYNKVQSDNYYVLSIPATVDLSYRIPLSRRLSVHPFVGTGLDVVDNRYNGMDNWNSYLMFDGGLELKYGLWRDTYMKLKVTYGIVFVDSLTSGYAYFLKIRFPVPFIP